MFSRKFLFNNEHQRRWLLFFYYCKKTKFIYTKLMFWKIVVISVCLYKHILFFGIILAIIKIAIVEDRAIYELRIQTLLEFLTKNDGNNPPFFRLHFFLSQVKCNNTEITWSDYFMLFLWGINIIRLHNGVW